MASKQLLFAEYCSLFRLADQMRMMNFPQWFDLLKDIFSKFTIFLKRVKVRHSFTKNFMQFRHDRE